MKKYRSFSSEFKRDLIARIDSGEVALSSAAREHGLSPSLLQRWRKQIHEGIFRDRPSPQEKRMEKELEWYKKKVGELTRQVDLLKKINESFPPLRRSNGSIVTVKNTLLFGKRAK